jgi:hypothetical protein
MELEPRAVRPYPSHYAECAFRLFVKMDSRAMIRPICEGSGSSVFMELNRQIY